MASNQPKSHSPFDYTDPREGGQPHGTPDHPEAISVVRGERSGVTPPDSGASGSSPKPLGSASPTDDGATPTQPGWEKPNAENDGVARRFADAMCPVENSTSA